MPQSYDHLQRSVAEEYEEKGYGSKRANRIGYAVAGKQAKMKHAKMKRRGKKHVLVMPTQIDTPVSRRKKVQ